MGFYPTLYPEHALLSDQRLKDGEHQRRSS
jgi:hypothetical protein